jgi:predicted GH43/DUF377 family glycosyl hydrolase
MSVILRGAETGQQGPRCSPEVHRLPLQFGRDARRVITRLFDPGGETRARNVLDRVGQLSDDEVEEALEQVRREFSHRHHNLDAVFEENCLAVFALTGTLEGISHSRRLLIGSYFTMEYSIASAALFNPSIVAHRNQWNLPEGAVRFILSFRATGEGHVSCVMFRTGIITADHNIQMDPPGRFARRVRMSPDRRYDKPLFRRKLHDMAIDEGAAQLVLDRLPERFTILELEHALAATEAAEPERFRSPETREGMLWLARSNYELKLSKDTDAAEVVIFPLTSNESRGIEDLRMVRFVDDDGSITFCGTYTASDGCRILPQLMETRDFLRISIHTLNGACAQNKGMALFPRRIGGHYVMCSRIDGENLYIMYSDMLHFWETAERLHTPRHPWEFVQIGNCGSPLETPEGWLLLTHGVGPMRTYCVGAMLLDLNDPLRVIGYLKEPLIMPTDEDRDGYVPNVVYTCGAMIHNDHLYIPYATSDSVSRFAYVSLDQLLDRLIG